VGGARNAPRASQAAPDFNQELRNKVEQRRSAAEIGMREGVGLGSGVNPGASAQKAASAPASESRGGRVDENVRTHMEARRRAMESDEDSEDDEDW